MTIIGFHIGTKGLSFEVGLVSFYLGIQWHHFRYGPYLIIDLLLIRIVAGPRGILIQRGDSWKSPRIYTTLLSEGQPGCYE